jgi:hypothetical protein
MTLAVTSLWDVREEGEGYEMRLIPYASSGPDEGDLKRVDLWSEVRRVHRQEDHQPEVLVKVNREFGRKAGSGS